MIYYIFFILVVSSLGNSQNTLRQVHVVFRHGDRTPDASTNFPGNPYYNYTYFPYGIGELTLTGKKNSYALGLHLQKLYGKFLGNFYQIDLIKAFASNYNRAQATLQCVLAALLPPNLHWEIAPGLKWQPITYETLMKDTIIAVHRECPVVTHLKSKISKEEQKLFDYVSEHTNMTIENNSQLLMVQNLFYVQEELGLKLPEWLDPIWPDIMKEQALKMWQDLLDQALPQISGNLVNKIFSDSQGFINGTVSEKMFLYSGHDLNVAAMLGALNAYKPGTYIDYNAIVHFELHFINGEFGFKTYFLNRGSPLTQIIIPGCESFCPLDQFKKLVVDKLYRGENWCKTD